MSIVPSIAPGTVVGVMFDALSPWPTLLASLAAHDAAPPALLAANPAAAAAAVVPQVGVCRPLLPPLTQEAIAILVASNPRGYVELPSGVTMSTAEVLAAAATYAGLTGALLARLRISRTHGVLASLAANPSVPPALLVRIARGGKHDRALFFNPATPVALRAQILSWAAIYWPTQAQEVAGLVALPAADFAALADRVLAAAMETPGYTARNAAALVAAAGQRGDVDRHLRLVELALTTVPRWVVTPVDALVTSASPYALHEVVVRASLLPPSELWDQLCAIDNWRTGPSIAEVVSAAAPDAPELVAAALSPVTCVRALALGRADLDDAAVVAALAASTPTTVATCINDVMERLDTTQHALLAAALLDESCDATMARQRLDVAAVIVDYDPQVWPMSAARVLVERNTRSSNQNYPRDEAARRLFYHYRIAVFDVVSPVHLAIASRSFDAVAAWLASQLDADEMTAYLTLGPTWDGTVGDLIASVKALRRPAPPVPTTTQH